VGAEARVEGGARGAREALEVLGARVALMRMRMRATTTRTATKGPGALEARVLGAAKTRAAVAGKAKARARSRVVRRSGVAWAISAEGCGAFAARVRNVGVASMCCHAATAARRTR